MKPTRIGNPYTVTDHGKPVTHCYVWFRDGSRELMNEARLAWTIAHGRPEKGFVVYERDGKLVCVHRSAMAGRTRRKLGRKVRAYIDHKPYPLAA